MSLKISTGAEPRALSDLVKYEVNPSYTRKQAVYAAASGEALTVVLGTVLGQLTSNGQYVPLDPDAETGAEVVSAIALGDVTIPVGSTRQGLVMENGPAIVIRPEVRYPDGADAPARAAIDAALAELGIKLVDAV